MEKKEYLEKIQEMLEKISIEENPAKSFITFSSLVQFRMEHSTPELESLRDIYYFLCGIMFQKGISDYWNGREK